MPFGVVGEGRRALANDGRAFGYEDVTGFLKRLDGDIADFRRLFQGEFGAVLPVLFKAVRPVLDEILIVGIVLDEVVGKAQRECAIGSRADLQVHVGEVLRGRRDARIDYDVFHLAAFLTCFQAVVAERCRPAGIVAPDDANFGFAGGGTGARGERSGRMPFGSDDEFDGKFGSLEAR